MSTWPATETGISDKTAVAIATAIVESNNRPLIRNLFPRHQSRRGSLEPALGLFLQSVALVIQYLNILFLPTVQGHAHFPGPRKHLGVLDRDLIGDVVGAGAPVALDHVQGVAMEIAGPVEPGLVVEIDRVDDQRIPFPSATRHPQPEIDMPRKMRTIRVDRADRVDIFVDDHHGVSSLKNLKGIGHIGDAWDARQITFSDGIGSQALFEVLLLL